MDDQICADLQIRQNLFLTFDDNLVENTFEDDKQADGEDGNDLKEQSFFVLLKSLAV